jgi:citrate lyase beta subunit
VVFVTLEIERRRANNLIAAYEAARGEGAWVARVDDEVADASAVRRARQALEY